MRLYRSKAPKSKAVPSTALRREMRQRRNREALLTNARVSDPTDPLTKYSDPGFLEVFRLTKESFRELVGIIEADFHHCNNRGRPLPVPHQLLLALHYYTTGLMQKEISELHGLGASQPTVCRTIHRVSESLAKRFEQFVVFPTLDKAPELHAKFHEIAKFPKVFGVISSTHIRIANPGGDVSEQCRNSQGWHSLKCQAVVGPDLRILAAVACLGATTSSDIFKDSKLQEMLRKGEYGHLLGDEGYQCQRYLLTPVSSPLTLAEFRYNRSHASTSRMAKLAFSMIRRRFKCTTVRELRSSPKASCNIVLGCLALHNFILMRQGSHEDAEALFTPDSGPQDVFDGECDPEGESYRQHIINEWFSKEMEGDMCPDEEVVCPDKEEVCSRPKKVRPSPKEELCLGPEEDECPSIKEELCTGPGEEGSSNGRGNKADEEH